MVNTFQEQALSTRLGIPIIYGIDAVHGHGNVFGATVFPHNIGLGATGDPKLVREVGAATAEEVRATGIPWTFGPCVCVAARRALGPHYESFGEDPRWCPRWKRSSTASRAMGERRSRPDHVLATAKHYAGDGDTEYDDTGLRQRRQAVVRAALHDRPGHHGHQPGRLRDDRPGTVRNGDQATRRPQRDAVVLERGLDRGRRRRPGQDARPQELITDVLKGDFKFGGFIISDWEGIHQIPDPDNPDVGGLTPYKVRVGVNAGTDMFMEPFSAQQFEELLLAEVNAGRVSMERIDDAVSRILKAKFELGLFEHPLASKDNIDQVGSPEHRAIARQAVAESQVLLKNDGDALPLAADANIYVAGRNADNIGNQAGGWTIAWQGISGRHHPGHHHPRGHQGGGTAGRRSPTAPMRQPR